MHFVAVQCSAVRGCAVQCNAVQCSAALCSAVQSCALKNSAIHCSEFSTVACECSQPNNFQLSNVQCSISAISVQCRDGEKGRSAVQ